MVNRTPPRIQTPEWFQKTADSLPPSPLNNRSPQHFDDSPPRTSTPVRFSPSPRRLRIPLQESTPIRQRSSASSFHPTQSGSTISSIKELPVVRPDQILDSCKPSLLHISPILANMGITSEGHLRAMKRLSEETGDKELKEEALGLGMTVIEWAILLDKVQAM
ncbi:hypothetical protein BDQ17DRAFT_1348410 [Cyathus striatus]|nr:hypothetical protein BDQ17DRAFT_1348410 [Cyathus striatus]